MRIIKMTFGDNEFKELEAQAQSSGISVQDYMRTKLFGSTSIFTPQEAERRALEKKGRGAEFFLADLYSPEEWAQISVGSAGVFGKKFYKYSLQSEHIDFIGIFRRKARYIVK